MDRDEIVEYMSIWGIKHYTISKDLVVDVTSVENIYIKGDFKKIPVKFGSVGGRFYCKNIGLTTLENSPVICYGFDCSYNKLTNLEHSPQIVHGNFDCTNNNLTSLMGCSKEIGGDILSMYNWIRNFDGFDSRFDRKLHIHSNPISTIVGDRCVVELVNWVKTMKLIKDNEVILNRLKYVASIFDFKINISGMEYCNYKIV